MMKYMYTSGNDTVDQMAQLNISGNVIPQSWLKTVVRENGKPYLLAIHILADVVYWYRPTEIRDEQTGHTIKWAKKFKGEYLQKSVSHYVEMFGESDSTIRRAIRYLDQLGVIKRIITTVETPHRKLPNVLFFDLNVDRLREITYPEELINNSEFIEENSEEPLEKIEDLESENVVEDNQEGMYSNLTTYPSKFDDIPDQSCTGICSNLTTYPFKSDYISGQPCIDIRSNLTTYPSKFDRTNTKNTTEITTENTTKITTQNPSISSDRWNPMERYEWTREFVRKKIDYEVLTQNRNCQRDVLDNFVDIIVDVLMMPNGTTLRIGKTDKPVEIVKSQLMKLDMFHIQYVLESFRKNQKEVSNIHQYILTSLYNAVLTIGSYYAEQVHRDFHTS